MLCSEWAVSGLTEAQTYVLGVGQGNNDALKFNTCIFSPDIQTAISCTLCWVLLLPVVVVVVLIPLSKPFTERV